MGTELGAEEIDDVLDPGGTGVLALARDDRPYAIPVSYGYDPADRVFYLRLGDPGGAEKGAFLEASDGARLVIYGESGGRWTSVIAEGPLDPVTGDGVTRRVADRLRRAARPLVGMWDAPADEVEFDVYVLRPEVLSGRATDGTP